ncbi:MAG: hypothetical protein JWO83_4984 [Caulobacteraceae bacterium]|nr:hypothetical protein [Caulobacteraceae bacterium]
MSDKTFEMDLERQFAATPILPDSDTFALRVTARLDRGWTFRQLLIGGLGLIGGLIGAGQVLGSGLLSRLETISAQSDTLVKSGIASLPAARGLTTLLSVGSGMDSQVLWMSAGLGALAVGLFVTRAIREL